MRSRGANLRKTREVDGTRRPRPSPRSPVRPSGGRPERIRAAALEVRGVARRKHGRAALAFTASRRECSDPEGNAKSLGPHAFAGSRISCHAFRSSLANAPLPSGPSSPPQARRPWSWLLARNGSPLTNSSRSRTHAQAIIRQHALTHGCARRFGHGDGQNRVADAMAPTVVVRDGH